MWQTFFFPTIYWVYFYELRFHQEAWRATSHWQVGTGRSYVILQSTPPLHSLSLTLFGSWCSFTMIWTPWSHLKELGQCFLRTPLVVNDVFFLRKTNLEVQLIYLSVLQNDQLKQFSPNYLLAQPFTTPKYLLLCNNMYGNNIHVSFHLFYHLYSYIRLPESLS